MDLAIEIQTANTNPRELEQLYQNARRAGQGGDFQTAIAACHEAAPDNLLYAAWYYRLLQRDEPADRPGRRINWIAAALLSILTGLIFWALSDVEAQVELDRIPYLVYWWSPIASMSAIVFLTLTSRQHVRRAAALGLGVLVAAAYAALLANRLDPEWKFEQYTILAAIHIPLLCWAALGIAVLGFKSSSADRFAFLIKSVEVMITAGLYLIFGMVFGGITIGMFAALSIELPEILIRLIVAGGFGLLPVLAVASVYDPTRPPAGQDFDQGLSRFIATMMRLLIPLTLGVLAIYILVIPFYFREPFTNRDVLIVYNLMLFGIMGLLMGATPIRGEELSPWLARWLRRSIIAVAGLAALISLYALAAIIYRTAQGGLTLNRLTVMGWNTINIGILIWLLYQQFADRQAGWATALQRVFSLATNAYIVWGLFLVVVVPLVF